MTTFTYQERPMFHVVSYTFSAGSMGGSLAMKKGARVLHVGYNVRSSFMGPEHSLALFVLENADPSVERIERQIRSFAMGTIQPLAQIEGLDFVGMADQGEWITAIFLQPEEAGKFVLPAPVEMTLKGFPYLPIYVVPEGFVAPDDGSPIPTHVELRTVKQHSVTMIGDFIYMTREFFDHKKAENDKDRAEWIKELGKRFEDAREGLGLSAVDAAYAAGVQPNRLQHILEGGKTLYRDEEEKLETWLMIVETEGAD